MHIKLDVKLQRLCGSGFSLFAVCMLAKSYHFGVWSELTNNTLQKQTGYIYLPSILNAIIGITSCYCVILKKVILHDAIKTIQNVFLCFFLKKRTKTCFCLKKQKNVLKKNKNNRCIVVFLKKNGFFSTLRCTDSGATRVESKVIW